MIWNLRSAKRQLSKLASRNGYISSYHTPIKNRITLMRDIPNLLTDHPTPVGITKLIVQKYDNGVIGVSKVEEYYNGVIINLMTYSFQSFSNFNKWEDLAEFVE